MSPRNRRSGEARSRPDADTERKMKRIVGIGALLAIVAAVVRVVMGRRRDEEDEA